MKTSYAALAASLAFALSLGAAHAQSTGTSSNPLRGRAPATQPAQTAPARSTPARTETRSGAKPDASKTDAAKPKRERSEAQLANDERMRKCGTEWRTNKEKLAAQGKTWLTFSTECRARLKARGQ
jgi:hypothetical protein